MGMDRESHAGHRRRQLGAAPGTREHVQTSSPLFIAPWGLGLAGDEGPTGFLEVGLGAASTPPHRAADRITCQGKWPRRQRLMLAAAPCAGVPGRHRTAEPVTGCPYAPA